MALKIFDKFNPRANPADANYPEGSIKNETVPGANDGTPLDSDWGNDYVGFDAALLALAEITASGSPDTVLISDRLASVKRVIGLMSKKTFTSYQAMLDNTDDGVFKNGQIISTGGGDWKVVNSNASATAKAISNTTPQLYAIPLNGWWATDFGVVVGGADNFTAMNFISSQVTNNTAVNFPPGEVHVEYTDGYTANIGGEVALTIKDVRKIKMSGNATTFRIIDHDVGANNGLTIFDIDGSQDVEITGFTFKLSFINRNTNGNFYPVCGAIHSVDTSGVAGARTGDELTQNVRVHNNVFDLFHPEGSFGQSNNPYLGDPNNGFKIYSCALFGDNLATDKANQNVKTSFYNNHFEPTHNGYGVWVWAFNTVEMYANTADEWTNWASAPDGITIVQNIPMLRYHQFYCTGITAHHNVVTPRPLAKRVGAYKGTFTFCHFTQNLLTDQDHGESDFHHNECSLLTGDLGFFCNLYGTVDASYNIFNGEDVTHRPIAAMDLQTGVNGKAEYHLSYNKTNRKFSGIPIRVSNGAPLKEDRRLKVLTATQNKFLNSYGQCISFINQLGDTTVGVERTYVDNNVFDGVASEFDIGNSNNVAVDANLFTESTDKLFIRNNTVRYFNQRERSGAAVGIVEGNEGSSITTSDNYNYIQIGEQTRATTLTVNPVQPRVGVSNNDIFSFSSRRIIDTTGVLVEALGGTVPGGTAIGVGAPPVGQTVYIDEILIGKKSS